MSGPAPFGMRWDEDQLVPELSEAVVVQELVEAFVASGGRIKATAVALNAKGHGTRRGADWSDTAVSRILQNPALRQLIPEDLWHRCEGLVADRIGPGRRPGRRSTDPLGGIIYCVCGGKMYLRGNGAVGKFVCRGCRAKIDQDTLETVLQTGLESVRIESAEIVAALEGNPRAAEVTGILGGRAVAISEIWPLLDRPRRCQLVDLLVARVVVSQDEIKVVFPESGDSGGETAPSQGNSLTSLHSSKAEKDVATRQGTTSEPAQSDESPFPGAAPSSILEPKAYRIQHVAELLDLPRSTVYDLVRTGTLPSIRTRKNGGVVLVPAGAVAEFLERRKRRR